jgi:hypothetical protein
MEGYFDESVSWRTIGRIWFRAFVCSLAVLLFLAFIGLSGGSSATAGAGGLLSFIVFWVVFLFAKTEEPIGEWRVVLEGRAAASPSVYSAIRGKLAERELPIQSVQARRTRNAFGTVHNRLILIDGQYQVHVSVFEYGTSLYLGWMMWRSRRGTVVLARFVADLVASFAQRLDPSDLMLRTVRPRAMREVVHALCREGLHVAVEQITVPENYGFPEGLPQIEALPGTISAAAPIPAMPAPQTRPGDPAPWVGHR